MTHRALLIEVWGPEYADDNARAARPDREPAPQDRAADGPRYIRTDPGIGYRFTDESLTPEALHAICTRALNPGAA